MIRARWRAPLLARLIIVAVVTLLAVLVGAVPASAHPVLVQTDPAPRVVAHEAPESIILAFSEPIARSGSSIEIQRIDGADVRTGPLDTTAGNSAVSVPIKEDLVGDVYEVRWSVLGTDGHQVGGTFRFGVVNDDGTLPAGVEKLDVAAGDQVNTTSGTTSQVIDTYLRWTGLMAAALMLGGAVLAWRIRAIGGEVPRVWAGRLAAGAWVLALVTELERTVAIAASAQEPGFQVSVLTDTRVGVLALLRVGALATIGGAAWPRRHLALFGAAGAVSLATHGLDGHTAALDGGRMVASIEAVVHVEAAAAWAGGLLCIVLWAWLGRVSIVGLARAFVPVAALSTGFLALSGVLIAVRQVDSWMFLRWTNYGQVVIAKAALLTLALAVAAWVTIRARRHRASPDQASGTSADRRQRQISAAGEKSSPGLLRFEAIAAVGIVAIAAMLAGLVPGRGQPTFAQRGDPLTGAVTTTAVTRDALAQVTVAPARRGSNTISVIPSSLREGSPVAQPAAITVRLACDCSEGDRVVELEQTASGVWSGQVDLPVEGDWFAYLEADGARATAPVAVPVADPRGGGPEPLVIGATADLTGQSAERCRAFVQGLAIAIGRLNAAGGVDGGRKVVLDVRDDGGKPRRAFKTVTAESPDVVTPCGDGSPGAIEGNQEGLSLAGDIAAIADAEMQVSAKHVFRLAPDPFAEGFGTGQHLKEIRSAYGRTAVRRVAVVVDGPQGEQRLAGVRAALSGTDLVVERVSSNAAEEVRSLRRIADPRRYFATLIDGSPVRVAAAFRSITNRHARFMPTALIASPRLSAEPFMLAAGPLARAGAVRVVSEVAPDSRDGQAYANAVGLIFPGDRARLSGLRGYVTGLALTEAVRDGTSLDSMVERLRKPARFTDALNVPWREDAPSLGSQGFGVYVPTFLPANLLPESVGGMSYSGQFFQKGDWSRLGPRVYGVPSASDVRNMAAG